MDDDPLDSVYAYVERAYIRLQVADLLGHCLAEETAQPIHALVEGLVVAGPASINTLREILAETERRKLEIQDDLHQLMNDLSHSLSNHGLRLDGEYRRMAFLSLSPMGILSLMREQNLHDHETQVACVRLLRESRDLIASLISRLVLLEEIVSYLQDWLWGLAIQTARHEAGESYSFIS